MIEQPFNVSARDDEKQILQSQERLRVQNIGKIKSDVDRRKANTRLNERDHLIDQLKAQRDQKIDHAVDEQIRQKVKPKAELHIKPPQGAGSYTPKQREEYIRTQVKNSLGKKLDEGIRTVEKAENSKIDEFVKNTLDKERTRSKTASKSEQFKRNAADITQAKGKTLFEDMAPLKPNAEQQAYEETMAGWNKQVDDQIRGMKPTDPKYAELMEEKAWIEGKAPERQPNGNVNREQFNKKSADVAGQRRTSETSQDHDNRKTLSGDASTRDLSDSRQKRQTATTRKTARTGRTRSRGR